MLSKHELLHLDVGQVLFNEGDPGDCAYLIESGQVEVSARAAHGQRVLGVLGPGEMVGEMAIIDEAPRSASVRALRPTRLTAIRRDQVRERLDQADPTLRWLFGLITDRFRSNLFPDGAPARAHPRFQDRDPALRTQAVDRLRLEADLWSAVEHGELQVYYQPVVSLADGRLVGYEALLRWRHPHKGMVSPGEFIALAEETPLIEGIGELVVERVAHDQAQLLAKVAADLPGFVAVNVSPRQLHHLDGIHRLHERVVEAGADPRALKLEITESMLASRQRVTDWISVAVGYGYQIAIDDFGTGYSSLSQLIRLQADTLKIDQAFVRDMLAHEQARAMVTAIVAIAKAFDMRIVAEGIELPEQRDILAELGCDYGQGWLFGKAVPLDQL